MTLLRHQAACNTARLPGDRIGFRLGDARIGWVAPAVAATLRGLRDGGSPLLSRDGRDIVLAAEDAARMPELAHALAEAGHVRLRGEVFDVRVSEQAAPLATIDRGALPALGLLSVGAHLNGLVRRGDGWWLWVGRRAADKALDPGKLDHLVAGGVPAGLSPWQALLKEAAEEASLPASHLRRARPIARIAYAMERPEGLRRDVLLCWDVVLAQDFVPVPADGEVEQFELWPVSRAVAAVRDTDAFKFNVNLVLLDLFRRLGLA